MGQAVKLSNHLISNAKTYAKIYHRSMPGQIEYWANIGKIAQENPDLTFEMIEKILLGLGECEAGEILPYKTKK